MDASIVRAVAQYTEETMGSEPFHYVTAVVANCKMLAVELEMQEDAPTDVDVDALVLAAYFHDVAVPSQGVHDHQFSSAAMASDFLQELDVPQRQIRQIERIILAHTSATAAAPEHACPIEARILYDADKLGRLSGLAVVTSLIEYGARYPNQVVSGDGFVTILRHIEERFVDLYQSLNTAPARTMAREKFGRTIAFLDGVIEYLSDALPV